MASIVFEHEWPSTTRDAIALQNELRDRITIVRPSTMIRTVAGADISYNRFSPELHAAVVVIDIESGETIEHRGVVGRAAFPYVPGLLTFRETPAILEAWKQLECEPDALMVDGHGLAHPRRFGIACHLGLLVGRPTVGAAKSILVGRYDELAVARGSRTPILHHDEVVGSALRTRDGVRPIFVTVGNLIDLESAVELVLRSHGGYRQPEPTRRAHVLVNRFRRGERGEELGPRT